MKNNLNIKGFRKSLKGSIKACSKMKFYYKTIGDTHVVLKIRVQYKEIARNLENMGRQMKYLLDETNENIICLKEVEKLYYKK